MEMEILKRKKNLVALSIVGSVLLGGFAVNAAGTTWSGYENESIRG
jgi:hypothetical protein